MPIDVFVSVGRNLTDPQEAFVRAVEKLLRDRDFAHRTVGRTDFSVIQPLKRIEQLMQECSGAVIIALERVHIETGVDRRGTSAELHLTDVKIPTVWNQIEAGMAYVLDKPLLVLVEKGLRSEGLLETGFDWYVQWVEISPETLHTPEFVGVFADWQKRVQEYHQNRSNPAANSSAKSASSIEPDKLTMGQLLESLKPAQLWKIVATLATAITAIAVTSYKLGSMSSSAQKTSQSSATVGVSRNLK